MEERFHRAAMLLGNAPLEKLSASRVAIFGLGGVGSAAVEGLARCGVGTMLLIDNDTVSQSNINRQLIATDRTIGMHKTDAERDRILTIDPGATVLCYNTFVTTDFAFLPDVDFIIDAIDTVTAKIHLAEYAYQKNIPIISSMGTGNKLNPALLQIADIYGTTICPLAKVMRKECRKRGIPSLPCVYSTEPAHPCAWEETNHQGRAIPGSVSFVPPVAGFLLAGYVIQQLTGVQPN